MLAKTIIITGSEGNLGKAVVKKFIDGDYNVIGVVHKKQDPKKYNGKNVEEVELDLLHEENCQKFVDETIKKNIGIDVAVLTAGGFAEGDIAKTKSSDIAKQYQLNFETAYNIARPVFLQMMKQGSGRIFLIGSRQGLNILKGKGALAYSLSKSLLFRLAELLNAEAKGKNVVVSVIVPSTIDTPQNRESMPDADFSSWVTASQIADIIYFYSSEESSGIREPVIKVYGMS
jgi:NAD(P)-dependent dehydrogenase (short-subunit alcohol dehydrogenase family)